MKQLIVYYSNNKINLQPDYGEYPVFEVKLLFLTNNSHSTKSKSIYNHEIMIV